MYLLAAAFTFLLEEDRPEDSGLLVAVELRRLELEAWTEVLPWPRRLRLRGRGSLY